MSLNLLSDPWIPVVRNGKAASIRPDQISESGVSGLAWQRADFNLACLELLIGLVSMADPPKDEADWLSRLEQPNATRLRESLKPFTPFFELAGDGPRFLQDFEAFERATKSKSSIKPLDMLFIDSAGDSTTKKNADLMVKRDRHSSLTTAEAAMALYTLQAFAPSGGAGNRTSMRGGGPMTTLARPIGNNAGPSLWKLIFANVLPGCPLPVDEAEQALPWLRPTRISEKNQTVTPDDSHELEAFFGMPRRLRLVFGDNRIIGVVQKRYGTSYEAWEHPLSPYYRQRESDTEWLPVHPKPGRLSYRNWLGISMEPGYAKKGIRRLARAIREYGSRSSAPNFEVLTGGWAMDNMKPTDFAVHICPGFPSLHEDAADRIWSVVESANAASGAVRNALRETWKTNTGFTTAIDAVVESFFAETEESFKRAVARIIDGYGPEVEVSWHQTIKHLALLKFDQCTMESLAYYDIKNIALRIAERRKLMFSLNGKVSKILDLFNTDIMENVV